MARDRVDQQHGQVFSQRFRNSQSARLGDNAVGCAHHHFHVMHKTVGLDHAVAFIARCELLDTELHLLVVAAYDQQLQRQADGGQLFQNLDMVGISHAAAHQQDGAHVRINAKLRSCVCAGQALVELGMHRDAEWQDAALRDAALDTAVRQQFAGRHDVLHARHIFPIGMQGVIGDNADGRDIIQLFALFQLVHHLCGKDVRAQDNIRRIACQHLGKFGRAKRVDDVDDAGGARKIACPVVFRQLIDQTVQRLHVLGGKQIAFIDGIFDQVADIGVNVERMHFSPLAGQHIADGLGSRMMAEACGDG